MPLTRRELLTCGATAGALFAATTGMEAAPPPPMGRKRVLRIAHLTDIHVQPELGAARGLAACFSHVHSLPERSGIEAPDMIITGGDTIMDAMDADVARTRLQWELWRKLKADHCGCELHSVLGNHDVWGWGRTKAGTAGNEPQYGKRWACDEFGRDRAYTSFDRAGWHIVLLDSVFPFQESYIGRIDDAQWDWLEGDLAAVPATKPVIIFSHIPILSATSLANGATAAVADGPQPRPPALEVSGKMLHIDASRFQKLFAAHPTVKACASGHVHVVERLHLGGVDYFCNGAVSAGWWKGRHRGTDFGYALLDLHDDGTVESRYVSYGWTVPS